MGIYQRDNLNLQSALEAALNRRQAAVDRQAARNTSNTKAVTDLMETLGRAYEMRDTRTIDERIRDLMHERDLTAKAIAEQNQRRAFDVIAQSGKGFGRTPEDLRSQYASSMQGYYNKPDMNGYAPTEAANPYAEAMTEFYRRKI